jgi:alanine racemase
VTRFRPTFVDIDLDAIRHNVRALKPPSVELMAVVKAEAYGHGAVEVARAALEAGASWLGVALVEEGFALRDAGISAPILVLSEFPPGSEKQALASDLRPTVYSEVGLSAVAEAARSLGRTGPIHVKVDTGMHRIGIYPPERAAAFVRDAERAGCEVEGLWTHFARADDDEATTRRQLERFSSVVEELESSGTRPRYLHAANSAATILYPESHFDLVRVGVALYGLDPENGSGSGVDLRPALAWRSAVSAVRRLPAGEPVSYGHRWRTERETTVATVPVGYADGYRRAFSSRADVLIAGRRRRVAGTVTMDQILVDCGDGDVQPGDDVVLLGTQGNERISAEELAGLAGTINYEIVSGISVRIPREYVP